MHLRDNFIFSSWGYPLKHGYDRCYRIVAFERMLEGCTPPRLAMRPSVLKLKGALHCMNMGDKMNIINDANVFFFYSLIRQDERNPWRRTLSLQQ